jgi:Holliday junction DNA helicase RuvA
MIDQVRGRVLRVAPHEALVQIDSWTLTARISLQTAQALSAGQETVLYTVLLLPREEGSLLLYGFATEEERGYFLWLLRVPRVGPQLALAILSQYAPATLSQHLQRKDAAALARVKGVGKKLAQQIILELEGKLPSDSTPSPAYEEAHIALISLGFSSREADERLRTALQKHPQATPEELVRLALQ